MAAFLLLLAVSANWLNSSKPDLIIGTVVFMLVVQRAMQILKQGQ